MFIENKILDNNNNNFGRVAAAVLRKLWCKPTDSRRWWRHWWRHRSCNRDDIVCVTSGCERWHWCVTSHCQMIHLNLGVYITPPHCTGVNYLAWRVNTFTRHYTPNLTCNHLTRYAIFTTIVTARRGRERHNGHKENIFETISNSKTN